MHRKPKAVITSNGETKWILLPRPSWLVLTSSKLWTSLIKMCHTKFDNESVSHENNFNIVDSKTISSNDMQLDRSFKYDVSSCSQMTIEWRYNAFIVHTGISPVTVVDGNNSSFKISNSTNNRREEASQNECFGLFQINLRTVLCYSFVERFYGCRLISLLIRLTLELMLLFLWSHLRTWWTSLVEHCTSSRTWV